MSAPASPLRRFRRRLNRRFYGALFGAYRRLFPTPTWGGAVARQSLQRVLVVQQYGVGDMILTTPLIAFLREQLPSAEIDVLASPRNAIIAATDDRVARVFIHDRGWRGWPGVLRGLRARRYDMVISGQVGRGLREGLVASVVAGRHTHKVSPWRPKRYQGFFTTVVRVPPSVTHTADRLLYVGRRALGCPGGPPGDAGVRYPLRVPSDASADARVEAYIAEHRLASGFVVANVSAQFTDRDWPAAHCGACLALLAERRPDMAVVLAPAPGRVGPAREAAARSGSPHVLLAPELPLVDLVALVQRSVAVISPNTALVHIASACKRPVVALYTTQPGAEPSRWLPLGVPYRALAAPAGGGVGEISPDLVAHAVDDLLAEPRVAQAEA